ncbi:hypothetical protein NL676_026132 [Syzygium grande]|nr:hypothetical protein NL676_026132 [Syzygium grande]
MNFARDSHDLPVGASRAHVFPGAGDSFSEIRGRPSQNLRPQEQEKASLDWVDKGDHQLVQRRALGFWRLPATAGPRATAEGCRGLRSWRAP